MSSSTIKIFILDTNVILHDATCIEQFKDNDIAIPISVLEELDQFKRGNEQIHYNAREFLRRLDEMCPVIQQKQMDHPLKNLKAKFEL